MNNARILDGANVGESQMQVLGPRPDGVDYEAFVAPGIEVLPTPLHRILRRLDETVDVTPTALKPIAMQRVIRADDLDVAQDHISSGSQTSPLQPGPHVIVDSINYHWLAEHEYLLGQGLHHYVGRQPGRLRTIDARAP